jgi:hypothetical protein
MRFVWRSLPNPFVKQRALVLSEMLSVFRRRHHLIRVVRMNPTMNLTPFDITRNHRFDPILVLQCSLSDIEAPVRFSVFWIESMALKAIVREDRSNVPVELDSILLLYLGV